jgi:hypothetical protein
VNPRAFISALYSLEVVLREGSILREDDNFTLRLSPDAGMRLARWLSRDPPEETIYGELRFFDTGEICGMTLRGITVQWSVEHDTFVDGPYRMRRALAYADDEQGC